MFADPVTRAVTICSDLNVLHRPVVIVRRTDPVVVVGSARPSMAAHDAYEAVRMSQGERCRETVRPSVVESQHIAGAAVSSLVIVVVDEDEGAIGRQKAPGFAERA